MTRLVPLADIPHRAARSAESAARRNFETRVAALGSAEYRIVVAPGCHGRPYFDPPVVGWVLTKTAAHALAARMTHMPGGTCHARLRYERYAEVSR